MKQRQFSFNSAVLLMTVFFLCKTPLLAQYSPGPSATPAAKPTPTASTTPTVVAPVISFPKLPIVLPLTYSGSLIDDFSTYTLGQFPEGWRPKGNNGKHFYVMAEENGHKYLKVDAIKDGTSVFRQVEWDIKKHPILEWAWRGRLLPKDGNEKRQSTNDCTVAIYVVFPIRWAVPDTLKYTWSTTLPATTEMYNGFANKNKIRVLRSGSTNLGEWVVERRNIFEDYKRRFDREPANPIGIGVITDADNTSSASSGDYAYFKALATDGNPPIPLTP